MEVLDTVILKLNLPTKEINAQVIQDVMLIVKRNLNDSEENYDYILSSLWLHLSSEILEFDDQLLCSTCFFSVLCKYEKNYLYLHKILPILNHEVILKKEYNKEKSKVSLVVSLCYGIFQSNYLVQKFETLPDVLNSVLEKIFELLTLMAYEYSQYTFIIFKILTAFKKVIGTKVEKIFFNENNNINLLNLTNHNWENPITGVKNTNRILFQMLLSIFDHDMKNKVLHKINAFYWNKAKFLMLAEFIEKQNNEIEDLLHNYKWIDGLIYSLHAPGLVSAGADMYYAILKIIKSEETWVNSFLSHITEVLVGSSYKAIENFINYWCLATFKKFPTIMRIIISELRKCNSSEYQYYSIICVLKQGNKLGLVEKTWKGSDFNEEEKILLSALENSNATVRMQAFEVICISQGKHFPSKVVFENVLQFLQNNVNSDCTILRLSMLNNLSDFLIILHTLFINNLENNSQDAYNLQIFCKNLQIFIIESITIEGNYQRKITTVKILHSVLKNFNDVPKKKQKQMRHLNKSLVAYLKDTDNWLMNSQDFINILISLLKDLSSDVHNNVQLILSKFYLTDLSDTDILNHLIEDSLECIQSKFFFEIQCGLNMLKLIISILLKNKIDEAKFKAVDEIFYFAYNEITEDFERKRNVIESVMQGKQLHSFLSILNVIYDAALKNSFCINVSVDTIYTFLGVVSSISKQFAWEDCGTSSDFSEINNMVLHIINTSGLESGININDQTNNSGLYQIVLNTLWLNVKASCELAAIMIQYYKENVKICKECLDVIAQVLETSRHKGAIEAAGTALGEAIKYLTSMRTESDISILPFTFLKTKLNELLFETMEMSSITRRGAGLTIMVHRIVSNDCQKGKPLFHFFMKTLLNTCNNLESPRDEFIKDDEKDLPKAIYLHFLTKIVTDSSLASDMMYYSAALAELAFSGLANPHWQIRNAALQLYGALIPKLIGQKKASGPDDETASSVACDEFRTHSPKLWELIVQQVKNDDNQDIVQKHSNLVPILNTLANIARRYSFSFDIKEMNSDLKLMNLITLLGSPIYTVRRLTSRAIINLYEIETILDALRKWKINSENHLNGVLMVIERCYKVYSHDEIWKYQLNNIRDEYQKIVTKGYHSWLCKWNLEKMYCRSDSDLTIAKFETILNKEKINRHEPGASLYINIVIERYFENAPWNILPQSLRLLTHSSEFERYCKIILHRIKHTEKHSHQVLLEIAKVLLCSDLITRFSIVWETLYNISLKTNSQTLDCKILHEYLNNDISYKLRYIIPYAARVFIEQKDDENLLCLSRIIFALCNPGNYDVEMRYIATIANNEISNKFESLNEDLKINAIMSGVILLQDENEDVRDLSVIFHQKVFKETTCKHPFICLNNILNKKFLHSVLDKPSQSIQSICENLLLFIDAINSSKVDEFNPFNNDSNNIYLEDKRVRQILMNLK